MPFWIFYLTSVSWFSSHIVTFHSLRSMPEWFTTWLRRTLRGAKPVRKWAWNQPLLTLTLKRTRWRQRRERLPDGRQRTRGMRRETKFWRYAIVLFPSIMYKLNLQKKWTHKTSFTNEAYIITLGLPLNGPNFGIKETGVLTNAEMTPKIPLHNNLLTLKVLWCLHTKSLLLSK